jgi:hypothetical protein
MPNWCQNIIEINGNEADIITIMEAKMSFNKLIPRPVFDAVEDPSHIKIINWSINNWGTKWDIVDEENNELITGNNIELCENSCIHADVMTAWTPPIAFFETLTSQMEDLHVKIWFWEPGCELVGGVEIYNGHTHWEEIKDEEEFIRNWFDCEYGIEEEEEL